MGEVIHVDFNSKERLPDQSITRHESSGEDVLFSRPESSGGRSLVDIAVDLILEVQAIEVNGYSDQPGTMWPCQDRDRALSELDEEEQAQAWQTALTIVNEELGARA